MGQGGGAESEESMTSQQKKESLLKYREAIREAERLENEMRRWRSRAEKVTMALKMTPSGSPGSRSLEDAVDRIDALAVQLGAAQRRAVDLRRHIEVSIAQVEDGRLRELLRHRYIDGDTWESIAVKMDYSYMHVCRLHGDALAALKM